MSKVLLEDSRLRNVIRTIVKDIILTYKENAVGEFYLPKGDEDSYNFPRFEYDIVVQLNLVENPNIDDYNANAHLWDGTDIIEVDLEYNPEKKSKILYGIVGEINELIAHELRHIYQRETGMFKLGRKEKTNSLKYYTQPHEIDAQVFGFNRLSKLSKKPFDVVVKNWFEKNKDTHKLNDKETQKVIDLIMKHKK
jgi:hypothetical protein